MPRPAAVAAVALVALLGGRPAAAQGPAPPPPGPYVLDARIAAGQGLGLDAGGHVYPSPLGPARLGLGAAFLRLRGDGNDPLTPEITAVTPQLSLNFGSARGWSFLSAGYGRGRLGDGEWGGAWNAGAGARWFLADHVGIGFDLRYHRVAGDGAFVAGAGISLK